MARKDSAEHYLNLRIEPSTKADFSMFCKQNGLAVAKAIRMFVVYFIEVKEAPFCFTDSVLAEKARRDGEVKVKMPVFLGPDLKEQFRVALGVRDGMSGLVRQFMIYCILHGLPDELV